MKRFFNRAVIRALRTNEMESRKLRELFVRRYNIDVGLYTYGCFDQRRMNRNMTVGRYCSFAPTSYWYNANHGLDFLALHPYLYNPRLGVVTDERVERAHLTVGDDSWIGHGAVILPSTLEIGRGAVVAASSVVTRPVPAYAVVAGNPARVIRYRFGSETQEALEASRWWLLEKDELKNLISRYPGAIYAAGTGNAERGALLAEAQEAVGGR